MIIIDCGHGGMINGVYQDLASTKGDHKKYTFLDGFTVYEGVENRKIAQRLIYKLKALGIPFIDLNSTDPKDEPLLSRVKRINDIYSGNKNAWLLSIHSNKMTEKGEGDSLTGRGCETYIGTNAGKRSNYIQQVAEGIYKADGHRWRGSKSANFTMVSKTNCPALLTENYFYTNRQDAEYLVSDKGQEHIANTLLKIIKSV